MDSTADGAAGPLDRIFVRALRREAEVGAFEEERGRTQRLRFDVEAAVARSSHGDDVDRVLSYDRLVEAVDGALAAGRVALLETLAEAVAARVLREPRAARVLVRVSKLDRGPGALGVRIARTRGEAAGDAPAPRARVALLDPWADAAWREGPLVLCPAAPAAPPPEADGEAGRRVRLLALDQAAWVAAARGAGLPVAATLTEIGHALRGGRVAVWAPSRLALDAGLDADPPALAAWLRARLAG